MRSRTIFWCLVFWAALSIFTAWSNYDNGQRIKRLERLMASREAELRYYGWVPKGGASDADSRKLEFRGSDH